MSAERARLPAILCTTVVRSSHVGDSHGGVYLVDLETGKYEQKIDWNDGSIDWSGRGGGRGHCCCFCRCFRRRLCRRLRGCGGRCSLGGCGLRAAGRERESDGEQRRDCLGKPSHVGSAFREWSADRGPRLGRTVGSIGATPRRGCMERYRRADAEQA